MMFKQAITLFFLALSLASNAQGVSFFEGSFDEAKEAAKQEEKYIFMDAYAVWCGPCKMMTRNVFPQQEVGNFFNENFINIKVDMEKGEGLTLRNIYQVTAYPTLFILDETGKVVAQIRGARSAESLINWAKKSILPSQATFDKLQSRYDNGERTPALLKSLIKINDAYSNNYDALMNEYLNGLSEAEKINNDNADFIFNYTKSIQSPSLAVIQKYESYFRDIKGKENFEQKLSEIAAETIKQAAEIRDEDKKDEALSFLKTNKVPNYKEQQDRLNASYFLETKQWDAYHKAASKVVKKYAAAQPKLYQETAWNYYQNIDNEKQLAEAEKWMQTARELDDTFSHNYTHACLLYKLKNYTEAKDALVYAKTLSKKKKELQQADQLLDKINQELK